MYSSFCQAKPKYPDRKAEMGATIAPAFTRQRVDAVRHTCECGETHTVSYSEYITDSVVCKCGEYLSDAIHPDAFYPTEFPWAELHLSYSTLARLFSLMGLQLDETSGNVHPDTLVQHLPRVQGEFGVGTLWAVCRLAKRLGVEVQWG